MYRRSDPRFRRTINEISQTIESANESAQANIFTFSHRYLGPCFSSIGSCFQSCSSCFPCCDDRLHRSRARTHTRPELSFDFYDDWDHDETAGLLAWDNDDFDRLQTGGGYGAGAVSDQPARERAMSYGARRDKYGRRKSQPRNDPESDPTLIPASSYFGFLGRFSNRLTGAKTLRYKPSAADLQEHPGASRTMPSLAEEDDEFSPRKRSNTAGSNGTADSFSSRGDLFPSEDEDDARELDDEFAMVLERRTTGAGLEDVDNNGKSRRPGKRPSTGSRLSTRTMSSRSTRSSKRRSRAASTSPSREATVEPKPIPSLTELKQEEDRLREEEEAAIASRRYAARGLALKRGLSVSEQLPMAPDPLSGEPKPVVSPDVIEDVHNDQDRKKESPLNFESSTNDKVTSSDTVPFPSFNSDMAASEDEVEFAEFVPAQLPRFTGS
ncbi:hypothetical protein M436DRAFT_36903 [Aureobasidium namibiae CBS 147.97]|uniref:Uncharacterized protein n=1 Tax=Aureobasidium namibiae CBS 147.97 TaxID=1043004 RepID=A0A074WY87_9PEZI